MSSWMRDVKSDADVDAEIEYHTWSFWRLSWPVPCGLPKLAVRLGDLVSGC